VDRAALVAHAQESIAKGSRSFAVASKLFDKPTRERAWLLYSWCRKCDDIADGQDHGGPLSQVEDPKERLAFLSSMTDRALAGEVTGDPAFDALGLVVQECAIPHAWPRDLIAGFAMDADDFSPRNTDDLLRYCYHVAGVVGLMMAVVMGVDPTDEATLVRACDLGLAFQLANIARDIGEDADGGRCYIPASRLPFRARWAVLAAAGIYGDIAREVAQRGEGAWDHRVFTSGAAKLSWVAKALVQTQRASKGVSHEGLWTPNLKRLSAPSSAP
jgi:15-cis-phytoene synthase